ncbi:MAG: winged helix-turn-helix domain-containing protein [Sphingomonas sp.]|nr:winged helix-turn-helix domain-containing protein [Sphingomonas sp.]
MSGAGVDLAHEADFRLGSLSIRPSRREIVRDDGAREVLEPRVMKVLVALGRSPGAILGRSDLTDQCWGGRIVGEDAINRVIALLRRVADGIGGGNFCIETVRQVGYRLTAAEHEQSGVDRPMEGGTVVSLTPAHMLLERRRWMGGALALLGAGAAGYLLLGPSPRSGSRLPAPGSALMEQASIALRQETREGQNQAIGLYRRVVSLWPDYADGWSGLALAYASTAPFRQSREGVMLRERTTAAAQHAFAIEPDNARAQAALALLAPRFGGWFETERGLRHALLSSPEDPILFTLLALTIIAVGRAREAAAVYQRIAQKLANPTPGFYVARIRALWTANQVEETDQLVAEAMATFPTHYGLWFTRFYILLFSGRAEEAIALGENQEGRPTGILASDFDSVLRVAHAMEAPTRAAVDAVMREQSERARQGAGYAENAVQFAAALGRTDEAFAMAEAYCFGRGFEVPDIRYTPEQGTYTPRRERLTHFLFAPSTAAMRADTRFERLIREAGLVRYWTEAGAKPDYKTLSGQTRSS